MCQHCDGPDDPLEITDENIGLMLVETTTVALQASAAYANGWFRGARGLMMDMASKWGMSGAIRVAYVWGSAVYFLQRPPDAPERTAGHARMTEIGLALTGETPDAEHVAHLVSVNDQADAMVKAIAEAASTTKPDEIARLLDVADPDTFRCAMAMLLAESGIRLRYAKSSGDELSMRVFMSHVQEDVDADEFPLFEEGGD